MSPALMLVVARLVLGADDPQQGFGEVRASWFPGAAGDKVQVVERVRPTFTMSLNERIKLVGTIEAALVEGRDTTTVLLDELHHSALGPMLDAAGYVRTPTANSVFHISAGQDYLDVDRLYVDLYFTKVDVRVGRQALNWGSARFFNPTDPFPQVLLATPWQPRKGVNAVRATVPITEKADITAVLASNDTFTAVRATGRARINWKGTDFAVVGAYRGDANNGFVGVDVRGTLGVGFWLEGAWMFSATPHEEFSVGLDYSWPVLESLSVFAQYYRNGAGALSPDGYAATSARLGSSLALTCTACPAGASLLPSASASDPFAPFTLARDYLLLGGTLGITPELNLSATVLQNLDDGTVLIVPYVSYAVLDWLEVAASGSVPAATWGIGGEFKPRSKDLVLTVNTASGPLSANLRGLVPAATFTFWTRASF